MKAALRTSIVAGLAIFATLLPGRAQPPFEDAAKAAYLSRFAPFIDWPQAAFTRPDAPLVICVAGIDPLGASLERATQGQKDRGHPLMVRRLTRPDGQAGCHILFTADHAMAEAALHSVAGQPVLTVTDAGVAAPGMISFVRTDNSLHFDVDEAGARAAGLVISSKLLALARHVHRGAR